jgi:hypothetical protein
VINILLRVPKEKRDRLDFNTKVKLIKASEKHSLDIKPISKYCNVGKTELYEMLKRKITIKNK